MKFVAILFGLFILGVVALADSPYGAEYLQFVHDLPMGDKLGHFCLMGGLSFLINASLRIPPNSQKPWWKYRATYILLGVVVLEEISQIWLPQRNFSFEDLAADFLGILIFGYLGFWVAKRKVASR